MKQIALLVSILFLSLVVFIPSTYANTEEPVNNEITLSDADKAQVLNDRLIEINEMDKSALTRHEKRELRKEVKSINEELTNLSGGVYISVGAIIIILLLLILLL